MSRSRRVNPAIPILLTQLYRDRGNIANIMVVVDTKTGNRYVRGVGKPKQLEASLK